VPSKFIAADGKTLWLSYSHGWTRRPNSPNPPGGKYAWCLQEIKLLTPTNTPPFLPVSEPHSNPS